MKKILSTLLFTAVAAVTLHGQATDTYVAPRTESGQPDLGGVWNLSSNVPMQRPQRFGDREFMTAEEVAQMRARLAEADANSDQAVPQRAGSPGGYNDFWVESSRLTDYVRTSHLVHPSDGRIPARVAGVELVAGGLGPDVEGERPVRFAVGGIGKDGPEDRGLSERCIVGFNSGPPFVPSLYNNNVQIFQTEDHAVIITEMIHDARIVPLDGRPHIDEAIGQWSGDSKGYWDDDTLVVVTRNLVVSQVDFRGRYVIPTAGPGFFGVGVLVSIRPTIHSVSRSVSVTPAAVAGELHEYACHEGNYGMVNIIRGAHVEEREAHEADTPE